MPIQQKLPPPVLLFSDFAGWDDIVVRGVSNFLALIRGRIKLEKLRYYMISHCANTT